MTMKDNITKKLTEAFAPRSLTVTDESQAFEGKSRIDRHRMVNTLLAAELAGTVHALALKAQTPGEAG